MRDRYDAPTRAEELRREVEYEISAAVEAAEERGAELRAEAEARADLYRAALKAIVALEDDAWTMRVLASDALADGGEK